jgi:hypothetical protein
VETVLIRLGDCGSRVAASDHHPAPGASLGRDLAIQRTGSVASTSAPVDRSTGSSGSRRPATSPSAVDVRQSSVGMASGRSVLPASVADADTTIYGRYADALCDSLFDDLLTAVWTRAPGWDCC